MPEGYFYMGEIDLTVNIQLIIDDYCKIINTKYCIHLSNDDIIDFTFKGENLPHLLGLQYLIDIPIFEKYNNKTVTASHIFKCLRIKLLMLMKYIRVDILSRYTKTNSNILILISC